MCAQQDIYTSNVDFCGKNYQMNIMNKLLRYYTKIRIDNINSTYSILKTDITIRFENYYPYISTNYPL